MTPVSLPEQSLAGALLLDSRCLAAVRSVVRADDFASAPCAAIFNAACRLADRGLTPDPVTIQNDAAAHGEPLTTEYLMELLEITPTAAHAAQYAQLVRDNGLRRCAAALAREMLLQAEDLTMPTARLLCGSMERLQQIARGSGTSLVTSEDAAEAFLLYREQLSAGSAAAVLSTGLTRLDRVLGGGFVSSGLYILAARPGVGKTTVGLHIADMVSRSVPVLFVSLEMELNQLTARRLAGRTGTRIDRILLEDRLTEAEWEGLTDAATDLSRTNLFLNRSAAASLEDISLMARGIPGLGLLVVDYLGLIGNAGKGSLYERVTETSNGLKRLARSLQIPVLCLAQLNRQSEARQDKLPTMADLRDSGAIEQDADGVLLLHRPAVYLPPERRPKAWEADPLEITVAKNRHGQTGRITVSFYANNGRIVC